MKPFNNIYLYEQSPEALEAVQSGKAMICSGGIRDSKGRLIELAKPAIMNVADLISLFEDKDHALEMEEKLGFLSSQVELSAKGFQDIENIMWINTETINRTYSIVYEGFKRSLLGIEGITKQLSSFEQYIRNRDTNQLIEKAQIFTNNLRTDAGLLLVKEYNVLNGNIADHLDSISAFIKNLLIEMETTGNISFIAMQILLNLLPPFTYVVRKYAAMYYYITDRKLMPGNYNEWVDTIMAFKRYPQFKELVAYYINLRTTLPYSEKVHWCNHITTNMKTIASNVDSDRQYIETHSKKQYLAMDEELRKKVENDEYYNIGKRLIIFLDRC